MNAYHYLAVADTEDQDTSEGWVLSKPLDNPMTLIQGLFPGITTWTDVATDHAQGYSPCGNLVNITVEPVDSIPRAAL